MSGIIIRPQKLTALHEAAHVIVARHLGVKAVAGLDGGKNRAGFTIVSDSKKIPAAQRRIIGLAGFVADTQSLESFSVPPTAPSREDIEFCGPMTVDQMLVAGKNARLFLVAHNLEWLALAERLLRDGMIE